MCVFKAEDVLCSSFRSLLEKRQGGFVLIPGGGERELICEKRERKPRYWADEVAFLIELSSNRYEANFDWLVKGF